MVAASGMEGASADRMIFRHPHVALRRMRLHWVCSGVNTPAGRRGPEAG
jgi:hypothetical protein